MTDVLVDDAPRRARRVALVGLALLVAVVAGGAAVRSTLPPPPLDVRVEGTSGTALQGDGFAQVRVTVLSQQVREVDGAVLAVAGASAPGRHPDSFDDQGALTVQFALTPDCDLVSEQAEAIATGRLELAVRDTDGEPRAVELDVPDDGPLGRLLRSTCEL